MCPLVAYHAVIVRFFVCLTRIEIPNQGDRIHSDYVFLPFYLEKLKSQNSPNMLSYKAVRPSQLPQSCGHFYYGCGVL